MIHNSIIDEYKEKLEKDEYTLFSNFINDDILGENALNYSDDVYESTIIEIDDIEENIDNIVSELRDVIKNSNDIVNNHNNKVTNTAGISAISMLSNDLNIKEANFLSSIIIYILSKKISYNRSKESIDSNIKLLFNLFNEIYSSGIMKKLKNTTRIHPNTINDIFKRQIKANKELWKMIENDYPEYYLKIKD